MPRDDDNDDDNSPDTFVLNPAQPLETVRAIQLLLSGSDHEDDEEDTAATISDQARDEMARQGVAVNDISMHGLVSLNSLTARDVLDSPFFVLKGLSALPHVEQDVDGRMSGDVSKTAREVLARFFGFNVRFEEWGSFAADTANESENDDPPSHLRTERYKTWGLLLYRFLDSTFDATIPKVGKTKELAFLEQVLNGPLNSFGFIFAEIPGSAHDCEIMEFGENGDTFVFGEGKESGMLPRLCTKFGSQLCLFGFATRVVKASSSTTRRWTARYRNLRTLLGLPDTAKVKDVDQQASPLAEELLKLEGGIQQVAVSVLEKRRQGLFEEHDAVNLWASVMQACHYTVRNRRTMSMVLSARVFWFIRLRINDDQCTLEISVGHRFGAPSFLRQLIMFLIRARDADLMDDMELRQWEAALAVEVEEETTEEDEGGAGDDNGEAEEGNTEEEEEGGDTEDKEEDSDEDSKPPPAKRPKRSASTVRGRSHTDPPEDSPPPLTDQNDKKVDFSTPRHVDKYGVAVPWLYQIGKRLDLLGTGRSGSVTRNMWGGKPVAVKTFVLQEDDDRSFYDVYRHECKVLVSLKPLWGTHVPRLLFRHPWKTSPMIGLQLGEPLGDDMSTWDADDRKKAEETIEKVAALGWIQHDMRGSNFVRLNEGRNDYVAMIDFESVEKIQCRLTAID